jgi:Holliday junction resolvase
MAETTHKQDRQSAPVPLEKSITASILRYLNDLPGCYAVKTRGDFRQAGWPDIIGCYQGQALALEVKRPGRKPTKLQETMLQKWREAGAIAAVVTSRKEVEELLQKEAFSPCSELMN